MTRKHSNRFVFAAAILILLAALSHFAATPADYRGRVEAAKANIDLLSESLDSGASVSERGTMAEISTLIPASETIDWPGGSVETDNTWLGTRLRDLASESDITKRRAILEEISERLTAISDMVGELEAAAATDRSKDADKQKLAEILRREEYQKPQAQEKSMFQKWLDAFLEWLASIFPRPAITPGTESQADQPFSVVFQILIYALVFGVIVFLVYRFGGGFLERFGRNNVKKSRSRVIFGERIADGQSSADLFSEAEQLARDGNLRGAIRKGYVALLCELERRKVLRIRDHKTNRDYLRDVRSNNTLYDNMNGLTLNFERNWYGLRVAEQADWDDFREKYRGAVDSVKT